MTNWAASLIPVGSLFAGSLLTMVGQALTDRRISRREREKRLDGYRVRSFEIERETLLSLQEAIKQHFFLVIDRYENPSTEEEQKYYEGEHLIGMLADRCRAHEAAEAAHTFAVEASYIWEEKRQKTKDKPLADSHRAAQNSSVRHSNVTPSAKMAHPASAVDRT